jgi:putative DNA primase/helicase
VQKDQMISLLAAGVRGDDVKRHPVWYQRGAYYLDEIGFDPAGTDKDVRLNTWQGWPVRAAEGKCELILELLFQQCSKEKEIASALFKWVLQWIANPLQNPGAKMGSALVMHGPQGTGKSKFFTTVAELYGYGRRRRNYAIVIDGQALHANFNLDWKNKLYIVAEEVVNAQDKWELKNQLKHLVTGQTIRVEGKHMNAVHNTNRVNIVFLSNDLLPFPIEPDDRRHCVIYTPPPLEKSFFKSLVEEIENGGREAFYHYLLNEVDLSDFDHTRPPMTEAKRKLQRLSSSSEFRFLSDWSLGEISLPICPALASDVYAAYVRWCRNNGEQRPRPSNVFHATVGHLGAGWEKKKCRIYTRATSTETEPKPLIIPPPEAMQLAGTAMKEGTPVAKWLTESVGAFRKAVHGNDEERNEWAA